MGPGGSGAFADQDSSLHRYPRTILDPDELAAIGDMLLLTNGDFQVGRSDPGSSNLRLDVNAGPVSKGILKSNGFNVTQENQTVTIGSNRTYRFRNANNLAQANDVAIGPDVATTLNNLKAAIDAIQPPAGRYHADTQANPDATVPPAYPNNTTGNRFRVDGKVVGAAVPASTTVTNWSWSGLTGDTTGNLSPIVSMVGINVPPGGAAYGALEVRHIGSGFPTLNLNQKVPGAIVIQILKENDSRGRLLIAADGKHSWGPGNVDPDTTLFRPPNTPNTLQTEGDFYISTAGPARGLILKSPDGRCWRITIDDGGILLRTLVACPT